LDSSNETVILFRPCNRRKNNSSLCRGIAVISEEETLAAKVGKGDAGWVKGCQGFSAESTFNIWKMVRGRNDLDKRPLDESSQSEAAAR
jgi:hypothetical protein